VQLGSLPAGPDLSNIGARAGCEVVPKPEAKELAACLLSLRATVPLYDAPACCALAHFG
jgi:hypothetical protein